MQLIAYLSFNGQCKEAFEFYEKALGGKIVSMSTYGETPAGEHSSESMQGQIIHARIAVGDALLMGSDSGPDRYERPQGISITVQASDAAEADRVFVALSEGGAVTMPIQQTFWAERFGMLTDRYGVSWMINYEKQT